MSRRDSLMNAQQSVAAGLLDEGITVVYDAETPYADLKNRVMHARPLPEQMSEDDLLHLRADVDHETGHFGATDPDVVEGIKRPLVKLVQNAIEDGFIERWVSGRWLGSAQTLRRSNDLVCAEIRANASGALADRRARALNALQFITFGEPTHLVLDRLGADIEPLLAEIADLFPQLALVNDTATGLQFAREIVDRWCWGNTNRKKVSADQYGQNKKFQQAEDRAAKQVKKKAAVAEQRKVKIGAMPLQKVGFYRAWTQNDTVTTIYVRERDSRKTAEFLASVRNVVPPLRRRLLMEFRARTSRESYGFKRGQLDQSSLHRVAVGHADVFTQEIPARAVEADVVLLVDVSGSMLRWASAEVTRVRIAAQAACAFSMVLDRIGVTNECLAFTTGDPTTLPHDIYDAFGRGEYERVRPLRHLIIKGAHERFRQTTSRFSALAGLTSGHENIDGEALLWAAQRSLSRCGRRKPVIIVLSDGAPASAPEDMGVLDDHMKLAVERVKAAGVSLIGVGIATKSVSRFYENNVEIKDVNDLVGASYAVLRDVLRSAMRNR